MRLENMAKIAKLCGISKTTFAKIRKDPTFPKPITHNLYHLDSVKNWFIEKSQKTISTKNKNPENFDIEFASLERKINNGQNTQT